MIEEKIAFPIAQYSGFGMMNLSIQFDGKPFLRAVKIQHIFSDAMLSSEFSSVEARTFQ